MKRLTLVSVSLLVTLSLIIVNCAFPSIKDTFNPISNAPDFIYPNFTDHEDVNIASPSNGAVPKYNATSGKWEAGTDETGAAEGGITTLNGLNATTQLFATSNSTLLNISSATATHTFTPQADLHQYSWANVLAGDLPDLSSLYANISHDHSGVYEPVDATIVRTGQTNAFGAFNQTFDTSVLVVDAANDRVGIGDTTPDSKFDVDGLIKTWNITVGMDSGMYESGIFRLYSYSNQGTHHYYWNLTGNSVASANVNWFAPATQPTGASFVTINATGHLGYDTATYQPYNSTLHAIANLTPESGYLHYNGTAFVYDTPSGAAHDAVTLDANAGAILSLNDQEIGLDTQTANYVWAGPVSGDAAVPAFRALVAGDIPDISAKYQVANANLTTWAGITPGSNVGTFIATPSSANFASALTGETGSGAVVFDEAPTINNATLNGTVSMGAKKLYPDFAKSFHITNATATADRALWRVPYNATITAVHGVLSSGTYMLGMLTECDANGANCVVCDDSDMNITTTNTNDDGTLSNPSIDAGDWIGWNTTSVSGTINVSISFEGYYN